MHHLVLRGAFHGLHCRQFLCIRTHYLDGSHLRPVPGTPISRLRGRPTFQNFGCYSAALRRRQVRKGFYDRWNGIRAQQGRVANIQAAPSFGPFQISAGDQRVRIKRLEDNYQPETGHEGSEGKPVAAPRQHSHRKPEKHYRQPAHKRGCVQPLLGKSVLCLVQ